MIDDFSRPPIVFQPPGQSSTNGTDSLYDLNPSAGRIRCREFFRNFRVSQSNTSYIYREALVRQWDRREFFIEVDLAHVNEYDQALFNNLQV